jgi:hypothetical protein
MNKSATKIRLKCPECKRSKNVTRESYDPKQATLAEILCPKCCDKLMAHEPTTLYFDGLGKQVWDNNC